MSDSSKKKLVLNASRDFIFSVLALIVYNGALQLVIYPGLETGMGAEAFGTVLYLISVVSIMGAGFGTAASYARMVAKKDRTQTNGDYNIFLMIISLISTAVTLVALLVLKDLTAASYVGVLVLMIATVLRYYADVEYRMNIRFKDYFLFFMATALGYCLGLLAFRYTHSWVIVLLTGELFGIIYTVIRGRIFRPPFFRLSESFKENMSAVWIISASNLISALILHSDRLVLRMAVGAREVTVFYTASLIGKIVALLTTPLNGIIISYLTNYKIKLNKTRFLLVGTGLLAIAAVGAFVCAGVSYLFVKIMYPDVFPEARNYFFVANLGQLLYFLSGTLMVVVMSFTKEKLQLAINIVYVIAFAAVAIPLTIVYGLMGMAYGLIIVNIIRFIISVYLGLKSLS